MRGVFVKPPGFLDFSQHLETHLHCAAGVGPAQQERRAASAAVVNITFSSHARETANGTQRLNDDVPRLAASKSQGRFGSYAPSIRAGDPCTEHLRLHA